MCILLEIKELSGYKFVNAKRSGNVIMVIAEKNNQYDRIVIWFNSDKNYDLQIIQDVNSHDLNFVVNSRGVGVMVDDNDEVVLFSGAGKQKRFKDRNINQLMQLSSEGNDIVFYVNNSLYRIKLKKKVKIC